MTDSITQPKKDRFDKKMCCRVSFPNRLAKNHGFGLGRHDATVGSYCIRFKLYDRYHNDDTITAAAHFYQLIVICIAQLSFYIGTSTVKRHTRRRIRIYIRRMHAE